MKNLSASPKEAAMLPRVAKAPTAKAPAAKTGVSSASPMPSAPRRVAKPKVETKPSVGRKIAPATPSDENEIQTPMDSAPAVANGADAVDAAPSFHNLKLAPEITRKLDELGFTTPTPIQHRAIPVVLTGADLIGIAQTGTGKTLAFGLPILQHLLTARNPGRALILLPTRELALQVEEAILGVARGWKIKTAVLIGGAPVRAQQHLLRGNPDILIATPGRLIDHIQTGAVDLRTVDTLVLDEADRMLDMGFAPQIRQIVRATPNERQTLLFSATMPDEIVKMSNEFLYEPQRIEIERPGTKASGITQELFIVPQEEKNELLSKVLYEYEGSVLVFARTRSRARRVAREISRWDIASAEIHADRTLSQRRAALDGFKSGKYRVLVATDIAARGIDVTGIELVLNYDLPDSAEDYIHRIGRTGRAGLTGHAISFAAPDQSKDVRDIEKLMTTELALSQFNEGEWDFKAPNPRSTRGLRNRTARPHHAGPHQQSGRTGQGASSAPSRSGRR